MATKKPTKKKQPTATDRLKSMPWWGWALIGLAVLVLFGGQDGDEGGMAPPAGAVTLST